MPMGRSSFARLVMIVGQFGIDVKEGEKRTRTITDVRYTMAKIIDK